MADVNPDDQRVMPADRVMAWAESAVYTVVAFLLFASAVVALGAVAYRLVQDVADDRGALHAVTGALDGLLLVFIVVELFGAVRATVTERQLVAEPFLIVGIIASIKEIVVASVKAGESEGDAFERAVTEVGVLGGAVLVLAVSSFLIRRKEREPDEAGA